MLEIISCDKGYKDTIIFVHGGYHAAWCWEKFQPFFTQEKFNTYSFSFRGHGNSSDKERLYQHTVRDYAEDLESVVCSCKEHPIVIVHSMGASVVDQFLNNNPSKISKLIFLCPTPVKNMLISSFYFGFINRGKSNSDIFLDGQVTEEEKERYEKLIIVQESYKVMSSIVLGLNKPLLKEKIEALTIGSWSDRVVLPRDVLERAKYYSSNLLMLNGMCHDIMLCKDWQRVAHTILVFLRQSGV